MPSEKILVVEDDNELRPVIAGYLRTEGYTVLEAADGEAALRIWADERPHLLLLDWMLGGLSGLDVARKVRSVQNTPIIMLTARSEDADVILGLEVGADDYLVKPVSLRQVAARIRAVLRRSRPEPPARDLLQFGDLTVDLVGHAVKQKGAEVPLTATQFKVLAVLARNPNRVFSRMQLMEAATGDYYDGYERTIDSHISHLRRKLGADELIQTVHGIGYKLVPPGE
ncbi:MAG TPA: response regulator transcription factor [Symbiobacteriaceae bacterium]|nr:response regulator transcription factor [Symbiobacteriaceae bacterium]